MNGDALRYVADVVEGDWREHKRTSYKWFMFAKWDYHTYIYRQSLTYCLSCNMDDCYELGSLKRDLDIADKQVSDYRLYLSKDEENLAYHRRGLVKDTYAKEVLDHQSSRKLHHKKEEIKAKQEAKKLSEERNELDEKGKKQKRAMRERAALCLLRSGKSA